MRFTKMHGNGNDFLLIDCFESYVSDPAALAERACQPHTGVGADGLVLLEPGESAPYAMRVFNKDGSEAEMCGNAARCVGKYQYERGITHEKEITLETGAGLTSLQIETEGELVTRVTVDMGTPVLEPRLIPVDMAGQTVLNHRMQVLGQMWFVTCVSVGTPHCVIFVRDPEVIDLPVVGPAFEHHPLFPKHTNVEFVHVADRGTLQMRVWERGAGETLSCGTGACAALVAAVLCGHCDRTIRAEMAGGAFSLHWNADDNHVYLTGPAAFVFDGEWAED
ncbi:MAG: diaminopimelate epimerase [Clostridia bacterium]|nr:diaminopimelate epimerase [Clostridia bacterium]